MDSERDRAGEDQGKAGDGDPPDGTTLDDLRVGVLDLLTEIHEEVSHDRHPYPYEVRVHRQCPPLAS